jgi:hypothetical protein
MERLRVELTGKRHNLIVVDLVRLRSESLSDVHVVQEMRMSSAPWVGIGHNL